MSAAWFSLTVRFLDPVFHGRRDGGEPEWPPSPLRVFQALLAAAAARGRSEELNAGARAALEWLAARPPPRVIAPATTRGVAYSRSVPNNAMDIVGHAWSRGHVSDTGDASPNKHRTMKTICPVRLVDGDAVRYLWELPERPNDDESARVELLCEFARSIVALGWGVDQVVAQGAIAAAAEAAAWPGERWSPHGSASGMRLRVPKGGTVGALIDRHQRWLRRIAGDEFTAPPPLTAFELVEYRRATDPTRRPLAVFSLRAPDTDGLRAFDTTRRGLTVAGMLRHATREAAHNAGWPEREIDAFVLGHGEARDAREHVSVGARRFAYWPLPSIEARAGGGTHVVGSIRRVALASFADDAGPQLAWAQRALSGRELQPEADARPAALLTELPDDDRVLAQYQCPATDWATVTPVVLPGHDDPGHYRRRIERGATVDEQRRLLARLDERIDALLRKSMVQSGCSPLLSRCAALDWRKVGFWPGAEPADRYGVPHHLRRFPRFHVRVQWRDEQRRPLKVMGPLCIGAGRFYGLGLFAALPEDALAAATPAKGS